MTRQERNQKYYKEHKDKIRAQQTLYNKKHKIVLNQNQKEYYRNNVLKVKNYQKEYNMLNKDVVKHKKHLYYKKTAHRARTNVLIRKYGITREQFEQMVVAQNHKCPICNSILILQGKCKFAIDHDHVTGRTRQILCGKCNTGLGQFNDSIDLLQNAVDYLKKWKV